MRVTFLLLLLAIPSFVVADEPQEPATFGDLVERHQHATAESAVQAAKLSRPTIERLGFDPLKCQYLDRIENKLKLTAEQRAAFQQQGYVTLTSPKHISFGTAYDDIYRADLPVLITSDSILHVLHRSFDNTVMQLEEQVFANLLTEVLVDSLRKLHQLQIKPTDPLIANYEDADLFLSVALSLLSGRTVAPVFDQQAKVSAIMKLIEQQKIQNPLLGEFTDLYGGRRAIDYSQFKPRGHYTRSSTLQQYFRCLMWLGRADTGFFVGRADARSGVKNNSVREVRDAVILVELLSITKTLERLNVIDRLLGFLVGESDNFKPHELRRILDVEQITLANLSDENALSRLITAVENSPSARQRVNSQVIFGAKRPQESEVPPPALFHFFGQRFAIDSFALSRVVYDSVPVQPGLPKRLMPQGLDVIASLGNPDAIPLLALDLAEHGYAPQLLAARDFTLTHLKVEREHSVYEHWLKALQTLHQEPTDQRFFPTAMKMAAWRRKQVQTQLASWAELRHDTILFVKQSYSKLPECEYPAGFVEPYPEFFVQTRRLADEMTAALGDLETLGGVTAAAAPRRYWRMASLTLEKLETLARKELANEPFDAAETKFIKQTIEITRKDLGSCGKGTGPFVETFTGWYADMLYPDSKTWREFTPSIADVHSDPRGRVLEVGVGHVRLGLIAINHGEHQMAYVGPIYTYYEFAHSINDRLTNEQFKQLLLTTPPERAAWMREFER